ncbi:MAG: Crp/Fnr family transcriptional regulator [Anaerolineae bacterium]
MPNGPDAAAAITARLRGVALFADLSAETLGRIAAVASIRRYPPDTQLLLQGDDCTAAYFVLEGEAQVYRVSDEGREQVLVRIEAGQAFNTVPVFRRAATNPANVVTLTEVTLCAIQKDELTRLVRTQSDLALAVLRDFADRLTHLTDLVESLALHSVQQRLARFLLDRAPGSPDDGRDSEAVRGQSEVRRWTQQEIAVHLGSVRDVVGRELRAMEEAGILRLERGRIVLLSREDLEELAHG